MVCTMTLKGTARYEQRGRAGAHASAAVLLLSLLSCGTQSGAPSPPSPVTVTLCKADNDCPQFGSYCDPCSDGGVACASSRCIDGGCRDSPAFCPDRRVHPC